MSNNKKHVMIDLETLGKDDDAIIASIGAVQFNPETGHVASSGFECLLSVEDGAKLGFKMDCGTVAWWEKQSEQARKQLDGEILVRSAILQLLSWLRGLCAKDDLVVWGNGPTFDLGILAYHFKKLDYELPWQYWNERCVRTEVAVGRKFGLDPKRDLPFEGVEHSALDDAKHQAKYVSVIEMHLNSLAKHSEAVA